MYFQGHQTNPPIQNLPPLELPVGDTIVELVMCQLPVRFNLVNISTVRLINIKKF